MPSDDDVPTGTATSVDPSADPALDDTVASPGGGDLALTPGARIGRYELQDVLGKGGMGVVFRARDPQLDRPLAIKIVLPMKSGKRTQQRLLDEAKAMAKLRHPAVVPVFDVGTTERGVYIVMPLVSGGTMHDWVQAERRTWRQVLDRYIAAGRGLAAAHAVGLVHRDFKPRNVLVGENGEVLVADFGIAAQTDAPSGSAQATPSAEVSSIAGTPAYMAPEQARGEAVDARADQYSFCISLWEGLHGERPGEAETRTQGALSASGVPPVPADRRGAPGWLLAAVARGFSPAPKRRWPSMTTLIDHLERRLRRPRRLALAGGAMVLSGTAVVALVAPWRTEVDPCPDPRPRLARIWDANVRAALEVGFAKAAPALGSDVVTRVVPVLDGYAESWRSAQIETCKATHVRHTQSAELLDRRQVCLDRRLAALASLSSAFVADPNRDVVIGAVAAAGNLPLVTDCDDVERLLAVQPLPGSPARRAEIAALEAELDATEALMLRGPLTEGLERSTSALATARSIGHPPLLVHALAVHGHARLSNRQPADETLRELARVAAEAHDDRAVAQAWIESINSLSSHQAKLAEAKALEPVAETAVARAGATPALRHRFLIAGASRAMRAQELEIAAQRASEALAIASNPQARASALQFQAKVALLRNAPDAQALAEQTLAVYEEAYGTHHPETAEILNFMSQGSVRRGDFANAEAQAKRSLDILEGVFGPTHISMSPVLHVLGFVTARTGRLPEARIYAERSVAVLEQGADPLRLGASLGNLGDIVGQIDGIDAARPIFERMLSVYEGSVGKDHAGYVLGANTWAQQLAAAKKCAEAEPFIASSLAYYERKQRPDQLPAVLVIQAMCLDQTEREAEAQAVLERIAKICAEFQCEPGIGISARAMLGEYLLQGRERARGLKLLREARAEFLAKGMTGHVAEMDKNAKKLGVTF